jgi:hypothetical protein
VRKGAAGLLLALAVGTAACSNDSDPASKGAVTTAPATSSPTSVTPETGPVTEADVAAIDQVLKRLDGELERLDSDLAADEGDVQ